MGFKLKSQKAVKQGGFKAMGSSPMKEDDVEAKIYEVPRSEIIKDQPGVTYTEDEAALNINMPSFPDIDVVAERDKKPSAFGPIADAINKATEVTIDYTPDLSKYSKDLSSTAQKQTVPVTTKTRTIDGVKDVEKKSYTTQGGARVRKKTKFDPSGAVTKTKKKVRSGDTIAKTKTKPGKSTKKSTRTAGSLLTDQQKAKAKKLGMTFKAYLDKIRKK